MDTVLKYYKLSLYLISSFRNKNLHVSLKSKCPYHMINLFYIVNTNFVHSCTNTHKLLHINLSFIHIYNLLILFFSLINGKRRTKKKKKNRLFYVSSNLKYVSVLFHCLWKYQFLSSKHKIYSYLLRNSINLRTVTKIM